MVSSVQQEEDSILSSASDSTFLFRRLEKADFDKGYFETLGALTKVDGVSKADFEAQFDFMFQTRSDIYKVFVIEEKVTGQVVGSGSLIVERKFIRQLGLCGHIEDIAIRPSN